MKKFISPKSKWLQSISVFFGLFTASIVSADIVRDIQVVGNLRIETQSIKSIIAIKPNVEFSQNEEDSSLKSLFATNLFSNVSLEKKGSVLFVKVEENPTVNHVRFEGLKKIKEKDLLKEITLISRGVFSKAKLQQDLKKIKDVYHAHSKYSMSVVPSLVNLDQNRVDVIFKINEGPDAKIEKINFEGNKVFSDSKLSSVLSSKEKRWYSFFSSADNYNQHKLEFDKEMLKRFYLTNGYKKVIIEDPIVSNFDDIKKISITFKIKEGSKYKILNNSLNISNKNFNYVDINRINKIIEVLNGKDYNIELIEDSIEAINEYLSDHNLPDIVVDINEKVDEKAKIVSLNYELYFSKKNYINKINIIGNSKTKDHVIRRELLLQEGDMYSSTKLEKSERKLKELGYFDDIKVEESLDNNGQVNLDIEASEKSTLNIQFAGGYSTSDGPLGDIGFKDTNFLGEGYEFSLNLTKASKKVDIELSFMDPYFFGPNFSAGFSVYKNTSSRSKRYNRKYDINAKGFSLFTGYNITPKVLYSPRYTYDYTNISNVSADANKLLREQEGVKKTSSIGHRFTYDNRDSRIFPTNGVVSYFDQQFAGVGGNVKFLKHEVAANYYKPVIAKDVVLELFGSVGNIFGVSKQNVGINDNFYLGGESLKGFEHGGVGPRERKFDKKRNRFLGIDEDGGVDGESIGGKNFYNFSAEIKTPLTKSGKNSSIFGAIFIEGGEVFGNDMLKRNKESFVDQRGLRMSVGASLILNTPIGPIRFNYAKPIKKKKIDKTEKFSISFVTAKM